MAFLDEIATHLESEGVVGGATGWTVYKAFLPDTPNQAVALFLTSGEEPYVKKSSAETAYDRPGLQVRVRGGVRDFEGAIAKIQEVFEALHANEPTPGSGDKTIIYLYGTNSAPLPLGLDENDRPGYTWNFRTYRER